jgi:hypothetical protein
MNGWADEVVLFSSANMSRAIAEKAGATPNFPIPAGFQFTIVADSNAPGFKQLNTDPLLHAQVHDAIGKSYQALVETLAGAFKDADALVAKKPEQFEAAAVQLERGVDLQIANSMKAATAAAQNIVDSFKQKRAAYKKYQIKTFTNITLNVGSSVASIAMMASSPFSLGTSTVFGLIGLAKSAVQLANQIRNGLQEAETVHERAAAAIQTLAKGFAKTKKQQLAKLVGGAVLKELFGAAGVKTISGTEEDLELAENKIKGIDVKVHAVAVELNSILDKIEAEKKAHKNKADQAELDKRLDAFAVVVSSYLVKIMAEGERLQRLEENQEKLIGQLKLIIDANATAAKIIGAFETVLSYKDFFLTPVDVKAWQDFGTNMLSTGIPYLAGKISDMATDKFVN